MRKILIADDYPDNADVLNFLLSSEGYHTKVVYNRKDFFNEVDSFNPDLAIIDIHLGNSDGKEMATKIRNDEKLKHIKIILMTAGMTVKQAEEFSFEFCDAFIAKPFELQTVVSTVKRLSN